MGDIVITEFMDEAAVAMLCAAHPTLYDPALPEAPERLAGLLPGARALIVRNLTRVDTALLARAPRLRVVGRLGVGLDNIDGPACLARGVEVIPATGANADSVAEYVFLAVGMLLRGAFRSTAEVAAGDWPRERLAAGREMGGKTLGIIGFGDIGRRVARLARAFHMRVVAHDPVLPNDHSGWSETATERVSLDALFATADAVTLHVPLTEATAGLVSAAWFAIAAPPGTPPALAERLNALVAEALRSPALRERYRALGAEPVGEGTAATSAFFREEAERWAAVIRAARVTVD